MSTAMLNTDQRTLNLVSFIGRHDSQAFICRDGSIVASVEYVDCNTGRAFTAYEVIEPTISAVRDWLGY